MKVNDDFASHALKESCVRGKMPPMKVRLAEIRGERNLEDIANDLGVSISTVQRWEKHTMSIPSQRLPEIAKAYGCSVKDIFSDDDEGGAAPSETAEVIDIWARIPADRRAEAKGILSIMSKKA